MGLTSALYEIGTDSIEDSVDTNLDFTRNGWEEVRPGQRGLPGPQEIVGSGMVLLSLWLDDARDKVSEYLSRARELLYQRK